MSSLYVTHNTTPLSYTDYIFRKMAKMIYLPTAEEAYGGRNDWAEKNTLAILGYYDGHLSLVRFACLMFILACLVFTVLFYKLPSLFIHEKEASCKFSSVAAMWTLAVYILVVASTWPIRLGYKMY